MKNSGYSVKYDEIYTGLTSHLINRFASHNELSKTGHTVKYRPWFVVYVEVFSDKREAVKREKEFKQYRKRKFIREHIVPLYFPNK